MKRLLALLMSLCTMFALTQALAEEEFVSTYGPIGNGETLTIWYPMDAQAASYCDTVEGNYVWAELERRLGVNFEFIEVPSTNAKEMFQLMIASGDLPDIIRYENWYVGGGEQAVEDDVFVALNDYIDEFCPDYVARLNADHSAARDCMEDSGLMYWFMNVQNYRQAAPFGLLIRGDWLEQLGLEMPTTYDEMHNVLVAFKENFTDGEAPLELFQNGFGTGSVLSAGFGVQAYPQTNDWFRFKDGKIVCSMNIEELKDYISLMAQWYAEGLIDPNYTTNTSEFGNTERIGSGKTGVFTGLFTQADRYYVNAGILEEGAYFDEVPPLTKEKGAKNTLGYFRPSGVVKNGLVVTKACENLELALRVINYFYTDEGSMLINYGIEGITFEYNENGKPMVTDLIKKNPNLNLSGARHALLTKNLGAYTYRNVEDDSMTEIQRKYMTLWNCEGYTDVVPLSYMSLTADESAEFAAIMSDAQTYTLEWCNRFITGVTPLEQWDEYQNGLRSFDLARAEDICTVAYERYVNRVWTDR